MKSPISILTWLCLLFLASCISNKKTSLEAFKQDVYTPEYATGFKILGADKARLSKRHGATSVMAYEEMGYLPEALVNYLVRLGWSHGNQEIFSMDELVGLFVE